VFIEIHAALSSALFAALLHAQRWRPGQRSAAPAAPAGDAQRGSFGVTARGQERRWRRLDWGLAIVGMLVYIAENQ